jgi:hypothetical protein
VNEFRAWLAAQLADDARFTGVTRHDREDGSTLATRWAATDATWFEIAIRPHIPQVRVGVLTEDRWQSEEFEEKIEESGDTMREFVEMGFSDAGLDWADPPVEHYRADLKYFYFATPLELKSIDQLRDGATRSKLLAMLNGYWEAFSPHLAGDED